MAKQTPDTTGPMPTADRMTGVSAVVIETPRPRVSIEIERMTKGPAKVSVRIDGDDSEAVAQEVFRIYEGLIQGVNGLEPEGK
jgi:hypothetical protein